MLYAAEYFTDSLGSDRPGRAGELEARSVKLGAEPPATAERRGETLFHDAQHCFQKVAELQQLPSHDARADGLNWDLLKDGVGNPKNTKSMLAAHRTPRHHLDRARPHAEASVRAGYRSIQFAGRPEEEAAAVDRVPEVAPRRCPARCSEKGIERGRRPREKLFEARAAQSAIRASCTPAAASFDVGTGNGREKRRRSTPRP